jgi:arylsulfatase A-like enzyme
VPFSEGKSVPRFAGSEIDSGGRAPMPESSNFRQTFFTLWLRLVTLGVVTMLIVIVPRLQGKSEGWIFYLTASSVAFELVLYVVCTALCGAVLGTLAAALSVPLLLRGSNRQRIADLVSKSAVVVAIFFTFHYLLGLVTAGWTTHPRRGEVLFVIYYLAFAAVLLLPGGRKQLMESHDGLMGQKTTRRTVIGLGIASAGLASAELFMARGEPSLSPQRLTRPVPGRNVLLITFDALSAHDMSAYGYRLPTTPNIQRFAEQSSLFTNFFSTSTFTTPTVASILTGCYPSEHHVYNLEGRIRPGELNKALPHLMRAAGKATGASISSPYVHFLNQDLAAGYDVLPDMAFHTDDVRAIWNATEFLHRRQPYGSRITEFIDLLDLWDAVPLYVEEHAPSFYTKTKSGFPPSASFAQAREVIDRLPDGFFAWIHVMAPHGPYLPDAKHFGQFLPTGEMRGEVAQNEFLKTTPYPIASQPLIDKARLRYDEFIADADDAFGRFIAELDGSGRFRDTTVIVSADHGESFEGRVYGHAHSRLTLRQIHIPLIIRTPGQGSGRRVNVTADQTSLAPTILDAAGVARPEWMRGESLMPWLTQDGAGEGQGWAFTQYLATNSVFRTATKGTVGVINGGNQYVIDLSSGNEILRPLAEAHSWNADHAAENPELARALRQAIYSRFPDLPQKRS